MKPCSALRSSTASTVDASEGFGQSATRVAGHRRREFNMFRYPGLFDGLQPQYLLLQILKGESDIYRGRTDWHSLGT